MEDLGITVYSDIDVALESVLHGKETPEEREKALISFIKDYDKSAKEYENDLRAKTVIGNNVIVFVAVIAMLFGMAAMAFMKF